MFKYFVVIASLCSLPLLSSAFWWPKSTTETSRSQVLQQIPLTYFRTYTYQPLTGGPFGVPLFGFGASQTPVLSGRHYDPYAVTSYAAARRHDAASYKADVTPPALVTSSSSASSPMPAPTTTTSTTTTTTTPPPTTTSTTTTSSVPPFSSTANTPYSSYSGEYPTYNRRVNNLYNARPQYPYPDYFNYQPQSMLSEKSGVRIQFVPCMCPVSMPSMSGISGMSSLSGLSASNTDRDRATGMSISTVPVLGGAADATPLQARHMDSKEAELEDDDTDAVSAEAMADGDGGDVSVVTKLILEQQYTTPTVESNSLA